MKKILLTLIMFAFVVAASLKSQGFISGTETKAKNVKQDAV